MIEATAAATVPDAPIEGPQAHLSDPAPARAPHDPSDACVVQEVACVKAIVVGHVKCRRCGFGYSGAGAVQCALDAGMLRTADGWEHAEDCTRGSR